MLVREYTPADLDALRRMHSSQGFDYPFPDLSDSIFISKLVVEDDSGRAVMASLARLTCEMYLLIDREEQADRGDRGNQTRPSRSASLGSVGGLLGGQGFSRDVTSRTERDTLLPQTVAKDEWPERQDIEIRGRGRAGNRHAARQRYTQLLALHRAAERDLFARGLDDAHAWLPPQIAQRFGRRLEDLGWIRDDPWTPYCKRLKSNG